MVKVFISCEVQPQLIFIINSTTFVTRIDLFDCTVIVTSRNSHYYITIHTDKHKCALEIVSIVNITGKHNNTI